MPLPREPFTLKGGCNCGSVRYKMSVPKFEERPISVYCDEHALSDQTRFPQVLIDHCNDCRRATGSMTPVWIATVVSFLEFSIQSTSERSSIKGDEILKIENLGTKQFSPLKWYRSSESKFRAFCENCGTSLCYRSTNLKADWPDMVDFLLGTIDREDLEKDWLKPEREMWWEKGIPWVRDLIRDGTIKEDLPRHPLWKMNHHVPS